MSILTASEVGARDLTRAFNQAFLDYIVEVNFTVPAFLEYIHRNVLDLDRSYVAIEDGYIVGVLLCGDDGTFTWNAGMGVHPKWRRRGVGTGLLDAWLQSAAATGCTRALLEVIQENEVARRLYASRGFREMAVFRGYEGSPGWRPGETLPPGNVAETTPRELVPVYRTGHSWQKRPQVLERLTGFRAMRCTAPGDPAYIVFDRRGPILYVFDLTPNEVGRALLEHVAREEGPGTIRMLNAVDKGEEEFYRSLGFRPWITNIEMEATIDQCDD